MTLTRPRRSAKKFACALGLVTTAALLVSPTAASATSVSASSSLSSSVSGSGSVSASSSLIASSVQASANNSSNAVSRSQSNSALRSEYAATCGAGPRIEPLTATLLPNNSNEERVYCFAPGSTINIHLGIKVLELTADQGGRASGYFVTPCHLGMNGNQSLLAVGNGDLGTQTATTNVTVNCGTVITPTPTPTPVQQPIVVAPPVVAAPLVVGVASPAPPVALAPSFTG